MSKILAPETRTRCIVRELARGVKGRKKDDVIQVLLRHASDCQL